MRCAACQDYSSSGAAMHGPPFLLEIEREEIGDVWLVLDDDHPVRATHRVWTVLGGCEGNVM